LASMREHNPASPYVRSMGVRPRDASGAADAGCRTSLAETTPSGSVQRLLSGSATGAGISAWERTIFIWQRIVAEVWCGEYIPKISVARADVGGERLASRVG